ncbi:flagellin N-methylase [Paraburkholderia tropica]|uniref:flagellin N-methylase n=1 Tax=Paraburkholderia tropica TaxID=92647 RepID=UPI003F55E107
MIATGSLACSACGQCCNSPPALSLREWFAQRALFIGSIAIERVPRRRVGERLGADGATHALNEDDVADHDALADSLFARAGAPDAGWLSITLQGYDYPSVARCPALAPDGRCTLHGALHDELNDALSDATKPARCAAVPLDPLVPDRWQPLVLAARRASTQAPHWRGADCIRDGLETGATPLIEAGRVIDSQALERDRNALVFERALWRDAVAASLLASASAHASLAALRPGARLTIAPVPALLAVARLSETCRAACIDVIDRQRALIDTTIAAALARRRLDERAITQELRGFALAHARAREELASSQPSSQPSSTPFAHDAERWLNLR